MPTKEELQQHLLKIPMLKFIDFGEDHSTTIYIRKRTGYSIYYYFWRKNDNKCKVYTAKELTIHKYSELIRHIKQLSTVLNFKNCKKCYKSVREPKGCCDTCAKNFGYIRISEDYLTHSIKTYIRKFSKRTGFWRKNIGCILPREMRSQTCLYAYCGTDPIIDAYKNILINTHNYIDDKLKRGEYDIN